MLCHKTNNKKGPYVLYQVTHLNKLHGQMLCSHSQTAIYGCPHTIFFVSHQYSVALIYYLTIFLHQTITTTHMFHIQGVIGSFCRCCPQPYLFLQHQIQSNQALILFLKSQLLKELTVVQVLRRAKYSKQLFSDFHKFLQQ